MTSRMGYHGRISVRGWRAVSGALAVGAVLLSAAIAVRAQEAPSYTVINTFAGSGADGEYPRGNVIRDRAGNLYGTAFNGGNLSECFGAGCGAVFKVDRWGKETVLYNFMGGADGAYPAMGLIPDEEGNLYSSTHGGGDLSGDASCTAALGFPGCGVVFKLDLTGKETVVYAFTGGADGLGPSSGLVPDEAGNLYGTTVGGGFSGDCPGEPIPGCGVVFKLDPKGKETVLHTFTGGADGYGPYGDLLLDAAGDLYGAAGYGGDLSGFCSDVLEPATGFLGCGTVFKLDRTGKFTVLHTFNGADGAVPDGWLVQDNAGNLYGMTGNGGDLSGCSGLGCGVVFKVDKTGKGTVLYRFRGGADGAETFAGVVRDAAGNLYGTTAYGGDFSGSLCAGTGCGVAFKLNPTGKETVLYTFTGGADGVNPGAGLLQDEEGSLYSTTIGGGDTSSCSPPYGCGVVFKIALHDGGDPDVSQEGVAATGDETTEGPRVVLLENVQNLLLQRRGFGRFGTPLTGPR
ncbi:MAG: choice-of-anchor tandem repeat GloVer-containing protein [Terriglobia bacterium]|jgi:uncharacterized repeat protein (TIGR03803 family)